MDEKSTPYFFQYTFFAGKEHSNIINCDLLFNYNNWVSIKINKLIASTPDVPDEMISNILKKANLC
jgi:hypothetical protein